MMKSRKLAIGLLLMLAMVVTTGTFAYWASSVNNDSEVETATVSIGTAGSANTVVNLGTVTGDGSTNLVPNSQTGDHVMEFTVVVTWDSESGTAADSTEGTLLASEVYQTMSTGGSLDDTALDLMFDTTYSYDTSDQITVGTGSVTVTITVTFTNEPGTKAIYDTLVQNDLVLDLTFAVTVNP